MTDKIFTKEELINAIDSLRESYKVFYPVKDGDFHVFESIDEGKEPDFGYPNTRLSPKALVYPQSERMFEYSLDENDTDAHILKESEKDYS